MHAPGIWGIIIVAVVVILLFGRGKIAGLMGEVASGIKSFQKGMRDEDRHLLPPRRIHLADRHLRPGQRGSRDRKERRLIRLGSFRPHQG